LSLFRSSNLIISCAFVWFVIKQVLLKPQIDVQAAKKKKKTQKKTQPENHHQQELKYEAQMLNTQQIQAQPPSQKMNWSNPLLRTYRWKISGLGGHPHFRPKFV
jgi:hypothetical protein